MIYITGDCHHDFRKFNMTNFPEQRNMTKEDYVIVCGDFGLIWDKEESKTEKYTIQLFEKRPFTILFIDGNHENMDRLIAYPVETWNGGKVHKISPSVIHLMRGQVFELQGTTFFTFGGATSRDITGGILDVEDPEFKTKMKELRDNWISYRINHISWWKEEVASDVEMEEGILNLKKHGNKVDYIVTHCCATSSQVLIGGSFYPPDKQTDYFEIIKQNIEFKKWFFGHYHKNKNILDKEVLLYEQITRIV